MKISKYLQHHLIFICIFAISQPSYASFYFFDIFDFFAKTERVELDFVYSSEKQAWLNEVILAFNQAKLGDEQQKIIVQVNAKPMDSAKMMQMLIDNKHQPHIISPASHLFIELYNERAKSQTQKPLVNETQRLVLSPVVIAMWQPMAEALGWPDKPIGWEEIFELSTSSDGWGKFGHPEWGRFKFGHTHPVYSNSGMISILSEAYSGAGKNQILKIENLEMQKTQDFIKAIEKSVIHYGHSTEFFSKKLFTHGSDLLNAAVLYENMVIESYSYQLEQPIVAIYPKEGTFYSDHPLGVVEREWVTQKHREAAKIFTDYLLMEAQQNKAQQYGLRPANLNIPLQAPFDIAHGVDPKQPQTILSMPKANVLEKLLVVWQENKKNANILLVFDISGSMEREDKIQFARLGALHLLDILYKKDQFSLLLFNHNLGWLGKQQDLETNRAFFEHVLHTIRSNGGTALYDAVDSAYDYMLKNLKPDVISAIIVLSDGADRHSKNTTLESLLEKINQSDQIISIYPIAYGADAEFNILDKIAKATYGQTYSAEKTDIYVVFHNIATFF